MKISRSSFLYKFFIINVDNDITSLNELYHKGRAKRITSFNCLLNEVEVKLDIHTVIVFVHEFVIATS